MGMTVRGLLPLVNYLKGEIFYSPHHSCSLPRKQKVSFAVSNPEESTPDDYLRYRKP